MKQVITRFAPSPTGFLHIGGARTALFNYLFARHHGGKFLLRIEDTDRARSTEIATQAIFDGLDWLGIEFDNEPIFQFARSDRHAKVAHELVMMGKAYYCYSPQEEVNAVREKSIAEGKSFIFNSPWRDSDTIPPADIKPVVRIKASKDGETVIEDLVQGTVKVANDHLDDMILLRSDGTPTYMLAVVVDDHDMGITHIIRGDDHLNNAFRQSLIYRAMGWDIPEFAHIPLIHGDDGAKLSKRHGATNVIEYQDMGILPEAMVNYLLRLGWSHGDDEIISSTQAVEWFNINHIGKAPSRFDNDKLTHINSHYMQLRSHQNLIELIQEKYQDNFSAQVKTMLDKGLSSLLKRATNINDLSNIASFYIVDEISISAEIKERLNDENISITRSLFEHLKDLDDWNEENLNQNVKIFCKERGIKMGLVGEVIRIALTGTISSPSIFEVMDILGKSTTMIRINALINSF